MTINETLERDSKSPLYATNRFPCTCQDCGGEISIGSARIWRVGGPGAKGRWLGAHRRKAECRVNPISHGADTAPAVPDSGLRLILSDAPEPPRLAVSYGGIVPLGTVPGPALPPALPDDSDPLGIWS